MPVLLPTHHSGGLAMNSKTVTFALLVSTLALPAFAAEKRIKKSEVPKAVLAAVTTKYPNAEMTGFAQEDDAGKSVFEVQLKVGKLRTELIVTPEGKIVTEESVVTMKEVPEAVRVTLTSSVYAKSKVIKIEMVTDGERPNAPTYEIFVKHEHKVHELVFTATGELTKDEAKSGNED